MAGFIVIRSGRGAPRRMAVDKALYLAIVALRSDASLGESTEFTFRCVRNNNDAEWRFYFEFLPSTPDAIASVFVSDNGVAQVSR